MIFSKTILHRWKGEEKQIVIRFFSPSTMITDLLRSRFRVLKTKFRQKVNSIGSPKVSRGGDRFLFEKNSPKRGRNKIKIDRLRNGDESLPKGWHCLFPFLILVFFFFYLGCCDRDSILNREPRAADSGTWGDVRNLCGKFSRLVMRSVRKRCSLFRTLDRWILMVFFLSPGNV